jgi:signal transduction histidine kinase
LQAARLGAGQVSTTDVAALVGKLVRVLKPVTEVSQIGWTLQLEPNIDVNADTADLAEAIGNILDNACKWAASTIIVGVRRSGGDVIISVGDDGPGVPETERQNILRRGMSAGGQEPSSGLGLAIVDDIVRAYGARLAVGQSPVGGLEVSIHFPLSAARAPSLSPT